MSTVGQGPAGPEVMALVLPVALRRRILAIAERTAPEECCGLLIGHVEGASAVVTGLSESANLAADRRTGFEIDPAHLLESQRNLRAIGEAVLGHYHSHPQGAGEPSAEDRARALVPGHIWLIAVPGGGDGKGRVGVHLAVKERGRILLRPLEIRID